MRWKAELDAVGRRFAIVVARFNAFITERLLLSAYDGLLRTGVAKKDIDVVRVPGAFRDSIGGADVGAYGQVRRHHLSSAACCAGIRRTTT